MKLQLYNTDGRKLQEFIPINNNKASMYCCGPTVYNYAHIGNMRAFTFEDVLRRTLEFFDYRVDHVMNITDVGHLTDDGDEGEDKMVKAAREKGMDVWDISRFFTDAFFKDTDRLNILRPTVVCKATEHIEDMISMIQKIEKNGFTYQAGGNLYFDTSKFPDYGKMALLEKQNLQHGTSVVIDENKKNPQDFVLWFTQSKFEHQVMVWESPWGKGYPGWHIECSAMSTKYLGESFDIHCGGIDHVAVHHTNEIAQTESATGHKWVNYWLHNEFLLMKEGKMSKSKGGFLTIESLIEKGYTALDYRYLLLGGHYRSQLVFTWEALKAAQSSLVGLMNKIAVIKEKALSSTTKSLSKDAKLHLEDFRSHLARDLNTPQALADVRKLIKDSNISNGEKWQILLEMDRVLGLDFKSVSIKKTLQGEPLETLDPALQDLVYKRLEARKNRDFKLADQLRDTLTEKGISIIDSTEGPRWVIQKNVTEV